MSHTSPVEPPANGTGEEAWQRYAQHLADQLEYAERARAASRKAANRRSNLLNQVARDLQEGHIERAKRRLEYREAHKQPAYPRFFPPETDDTPLARVASIRVVRVSRDTERAANDAR